MTTPQDPKSSDVLPALPPKRKITRIVQGYAVEVEGYNTADMQSYGDERAAHALVLAVQKADRERQAGEAPPAWKFHNLTGPYEDGHVKLHDAGGVEIARFEPVASLPAPQAAQAEQAEAPKQFCSCPCCREGIPAPHEYHLEKRATQPTASNAGEREAYRPDEETVRDVCDLLTTVRDAAEGWKNQPGGWSGTKSRCEQAINMLRYGAALATKPPAGEQKPVAWMTPNPYKPELLMVSIEKPNVNGVDLPGARPLIYGDVAQPEQEAQKPVGGAMLPDEPTPRLLSMIPAQTEEDARHLYQRLIGVARLEGATLKVKAWGCSNEARGKTRCDAWCRADNVCPASYEVLNRAPQPEQVAQDSIDAERWRFVFKDRYVTLLTSYFGNGCVNRTAEQLLAHIDAARTRGEQGGAV